MYEFKKTLLSSYKKKIILIEFFIYFFDKLIVKQDLQNIIINRICIMLTRIINLKSFINYICIHRL